ncbi:MAG: putative zinc-finger [Acidobacteria bacterium]|nr:putative zinc-finger [Acidobacteriota bacterium]
MTCEHARELIPAFVGLELASADELAFREHLVACAGCRAALEEVEPATALALRLPGPTDDGDAFVAAVMGGLRQRRVERRLGGRSWRWLAAAAAVAAAFFAGTRVPRGGEPVTSAAVPSTAAPAIRPAEGAFIEVEGKGVRLYQIGDPTAGDVAVAVVVDPTLEL